MHRLPLPFMLLVTALSNAVARPQSPPSARNAGWRGDIDTLVATIVAKHPSPFARAPRARFLHRARQLRDSVPVLSDRGVAVRLMQLVASLEDGHTDLAPGRLGDFDRWYPIRFYHFTDGLYVTAAPRDMPWLLGARVERIGRLSADSASRLAATPYSADNTFGAREAVTYLSSAAVLSELQVVPRGDSMPLVVTLRDGARRATALPARVGRASIAWDQWGEMFGPIFADSTTLTTWAGVPPMEYRREDPDRPWHQRYRGRWRWWIVPNTDLAYFQANFLLDSDAAPFEPFFRQMVRSLDSAHVRRLVIDLRYNGGGDGSMARVIVHELVKRDTSINRPGRLFVLVGRKTFSAAITVLDGLLDHTSATLVGEPPGAALNHFGDPTTSVLPWSGMPLSVSTRYWQYSTSDDTSRVLGIHVPAQFTSDDWFSGRDPALAAIFDGAADPLTSVLPALGGAEALRRYAALKSRLSGRIDWWQPFDHRTMRRLGDSLHAARRIVDGNAAYRLNSLHYPCEWRSWDSEGTGRLAAADSAGAAAALRRALELEPDNWNASAQRAALGKLAGMPRISVPGTEVPCARRRAG